ncbi:uncharacterized protein LOC110944139 [Helianthus annuus]|uniref:uncharacterized protein LOC110944139 n=1 Tax=Helianthus annuus TaxID=4232 RepID=UPI0016530E70|nr:uncharacterized protein LOC110944139 [Helianthus annuus]
MRILSLTTSSSGCERNWSMFEGVHTKKRNRLMASKMNDLVFVQFNSNLMEKNKKRRLRNRESLKADDDSEAKEWIVDVDDEEEEEEVEPGQTSKAVDDDTGVNEISGNRKSARISAKKSGSRQLYDEDFISDEEVDEEVEYESDGVEIIEHYGEDDEDLGNI